MEYSVWIDIFIRCFINFLACPRMTHKSTIRKRTITEKYEIFQKKLTKEKRVLQFHGNIYFQHRRIGRLKYNLRLKMK